MSFRLVPKWVTFNGVATGWTGAHFCPRLFLRSMQIRRLFLRRVRRGGGKCNLCKRVGEVIRQARVNCSIFKCATQSTAISNCVANETVHQMLTTCMCVCKERGQSDDADNTSRVATAYRLESDLCADQYDLFRNDPSMKNVTSLKNIVAHTCSLQSRNTWNLQCHFINWPAFSY